MLSVPSTTGQQTAVTNTITVRNLVTTLNPLKRMKLKENQTLVTAAGPSEGQLVKCKLPLGNFASAANIMPVGRARSAKGRSLLRKNIVGSVGAPPAVESGGGKGGADLKDAIERRNARERSRVQQVTNGFAALRQRIPEKVARAFGVHMKMSKVETLRMAVEYIKYLERQLECKGGPGEQGTRHRFADEALPRDSRLPATPPPETVGLPSNFFRAIKPRTIENVTGPAVQGTLPVPGDGMAGHDQTHIIIIDGQQYMRIPGTNNYQYLDPERLYHEDRKSSAGLDFSKDSGTRGQLLLDEEDDDDEDDTVSNSAALLSESVLALSPQSNFTPDSEGKRSVESFYQTFPVACGPQLDSCQQQQQQQQQQHQLEQTSLQPAAGEELGFDQQQYLLQMQSDLEEEPAYISWIEFQEHQILVDQATPPSTQHDQLPAIAVDNRMSTATAQLTP